MNNNIQLNIGECIQYMAAKCMWFKIGLSSNEIFFSIALRDRQRQLTQIKRNNYLLRLIEKKKLHAICNRFVFPIIWSFYILLQLDLEWSIFFILKKLFCNQLHCIAYSIGSIIIVFEKEKKTFVLQGDEQCLMVKMRNVDVLHNVCDRLLFGLILILFHTPKI